MRAAQGVDSALQKSPARRNKISKVGAFLLFLNLMGVDVLELYSSPISNVKNTYFYFYGIT